MELKQHVRVNDILLGPIERPAIKWFLKRMPQWVTPNILTGIGAFAAVLIFFSYYMTNFDRNFLWLASFGLLLHWFGDSLDGGLAKYRNIQRPKFGYFIDHTVDAFSEILILTGIGLSPYITLEFALFVLISYLLMSVQVYITTYVKGVFQLSYSKVGPTELRVLIILVNTTVYFIGSPVINTGFGSIQLYDILAIIVAITFSIVFVVYTIKIGKELYREESVKDGAGIEEIPEHKLD